MPREQPRPAASGHVSRAKNRCRRWFAATSSAPRGLEWSGLDAQTVEVATRVGSGRVALRLGFDALGDIAGASADGRPRTEGKRIVPRPWTGVYSDYAVIGGIRIPTRAEVRWELADGPFTYWRGSITSLETEY